MENKKAFYDLVIQNGDVLAGDPARVLPRHSIGVQNGKIACIVPDLLSGARILNAAGRLVSPGFIDFHSHVDGKLFSAKCLAAQGATTTIGGERSFDGLTVRNIEENGFLINHGFYISHSFTLRKVVGLEDPYQSANDDEIENMVILAKEFLMNGAFGIHFGLEFVPGTSEKELLALTRAAKDHNRIAVMHLRKDGFEALHALEELVRIMKTTGVSMHISHLAYMIGFPGIMEQGLKIIDDAIAQGCDLTADTGLYGAFPSCIGSSILDRGWEQSYCNNKSVYDLLISSGIYSGTYCNPELFEYLREELPNTLVTVFACDENTIQQALSRDYVYVSTNAADGPHYDRVGHPETAGTFPKLIRQYVREGDSLSLEKALRKITADPARRFGLKGKGVLAPGFDADITIVNLNTIRPRADYVDKGNPNAPPEGIDYVLVNGEVIVEGCHIYEERSPGRFLFHK